MSLPKYPLLKDSRVDWLGLIPDTWRMVRLGFECETLVPMRDKPEILDGPIPWVRIEDFEGKYIAESKSQQGVSPETVHLMNLKVLPVGSVLCSCSCSMGATAIVASQLVTNQTFIGIVPGPRFLSDYLYYYILAAAPQLESMGTGAIQSYLSRDDFRQLRLPQPSRSEQAAIAHFLDREISKIDVLIAEQKKLLSLLAEKRQATISHSVTRGLNPDAPTKDSGVTWLGEVPAHWIVGKIQSFARRESGHTPSRQHPEYWENCTVPWFSLADVWQIRDGKLKYVYETKEMVSELGIANSSARLLPAGTVMLSRTASVGYSAIMGCDMATTQDFINWVCSPLLKPEFLLYVLRGMRSEFDRLMMGSTHQTIYMPDVAKLKMALPPSHEQEKITAFLDHATSRFDALENEAERAIALLQERRSALIAAAVTGQIDVRGAVSQPAQLEELAA